MIATPSEPLPIQEKTHDEPSESASSTPDIDVTVIFHRLQKPSCQNGCQRHTEESENLIRSKELPVFGSREQARKDREIRTHINGLSHEVQNKPEGESGLISGKKEICEEC